MKYLEMLEYYNIDESEDYRCNCPYCDGGVYWVDYNNINSICVECGTEY